MTNEVKKAIEIVKVYLDMDSDVDSEYLNAQRTIIKALEAQPTSDDEIIKALKAVRTFHNGNYAPQIDEAIRRLKAQPTDAVSREQALLALTGMDLPTDRDKLIALFTNRIQHLPSVQPNALERVDSALERVGDAVSREAVINLINPVQTVVRK